MEELYGQYKALLFTLAYQLTGSAADAEDAVQDVFVTALRVHPERLEEPKAYLCKMVTNRCLNMQKSARKKREIYVGPWLPEPVRTPESDPLESMIVRRDLLSYAMLVLLERLTPTERTVFVLREALGFDYLEIAELLGKQEANCRKLLSRAKSKMGISEDESITAEAIESEWVSRFLNSLEQGNVDHIMSLLAEDVKFVADGGGIVQAFRHPVATRELVARVLLGGIRSIRDHSPETLYFEVASLNGETCILIRSDQEIVAALFLELRHGKLANMYAVRNPNKLARV
ncbi:RNA polymerase sigma factor SigJ [Paenibacillus glycanilyticus]|uniref:RNA polymerase sigma factor SigJ n=1 Tax=Paenibacillus glycanilyticus TaxID=126569 RepID=A0ABQ6GLY5_9BACL|nr:RNA polymerase sigma factor SigJ [Paenibacillus glycanilyticus]GLX70641.1 RNA polymerase sigma factor SigJ [Paenibacillus glycanilyticus]